MRKKEIMKLNELGKWTLSIAIIVTYPIWTSVHTIWVLIMLFGTAFWDAVVRVKNKLGTAAEPKPARTDNRDYAYLYFELLYSVASKYPGETRHETALRYIKEAEQRKCESASAS